MTVDERIEKLVERHEALTQTVELIVHENREREKENQIRDKKWDEKFGKVTEALQHLIIIAQEHEKRISDLER
jgi:hypothetical protein